MRRLRFRNVWREQLVVRTRGVTLKQGIIMLKYRVRPVRKLHVRTSTLHRGLSTCANYSHSGIVSFERLLTEKWIYIYIMCLWNRRRCSCWFYRNGKACMKGSSIATQRKTPVVAGLICCAGGQRGTTTPSSVRTTNMSTSR